MKIGYVDTHQEAANARIRKSNAAAKKKMLADVAVAAAAAAAKEVASAFPKASTETQTNAAPKVKNKILPFGYNRPYAVMDLTYLYFSGPDDKKPVAKCLSLTTGDTVRDEHAETYFATRKVFNKNTLPLCREKGAAPLRFDLYESKPNEDGIREWRGFGFFRESFISDLEMFGDKLGRVAALLAARRLAIELDAAYFNKGLFDIENPDAKKPIPLQSKEPLTFSWLKEHPAMGVQINPCVALVPGEEVPARYWDRFAEKQSRYLKVITEYAEHGSSPYAFAIYNPAASRPTTEFYIVARDNSVRPFGSLDANPFDGSPGGIQCEGVGALPEDITAQQLAYLDCRLAAAGFEMALCPHELNDESDELLGEMFGGQVSVSLPDEARMADDNNRNGFTPELAVVPYGKSAVLKIVRWIR